MLQWFFAFWSFLFSVSFLDLHKRVGSPVLNHSITSDWSNFDLEVLCQVYDGLSGGTVISWHCCDAFRIIICILFVCISRWSRGQMQTVTFKFCFLYESLDALLLFILVFERQGCFGRLLFDAVPANFFSQQLLLFFFQLLLENVYRGVLGRHYLVWADVLIV